MINNNSSPSSKDNFKIIQIIYAAILAGLIVFAAMAYFIISNTIGHPNESLIDIFMFVVPSISVGMIFLSRIIYSRISLQVENNATIMVKLGKYRTAKIVSWAMLEGEGLFSIVAFMVTNSDFFLIVFFVIVFAFILSKPSIEEFLNDFRIEGNERDYLTR